MMLSLVHLGTNDVQAIRMMQKITQQTIFISVTGMNKKCFFTPLILVVVVFLQFV